VHVCQTTGLRSGLLSLRIKVPGYGAITRTVEVTVRTTGKELVDCVLNKIPYLKKLYPCAETFEACMIEVGHAPCVVADDERPLTTLLRWSPIRIGKFLDDGEFWLRLNAAALNQKRRSSGSNTATSTSDRFGRSFSEPRSTRLSLLRWKDFAKAPMKIQHAMSLDANLNGQRRSRWWRSSGSQPRLSIPRHRNSTD